MTPDHHGNWTTQKSVQGPEAQSDSTWRLCRPTGRLPQTLGLPAPGYACLTSALHHTKPSSIHPAVLSLNLSSSETSSQTPPSSKLSLLSLTADQAPFRQKTFHNLYRDITWCLIWWDQKLHECRQWNHPCHGYKHSAQQSAWDITGTQTSGPNGMNTGLSSRPPKIPQSWKGGWESRWGKEVLWSQRSICLTMNRWNHA